MIVFMFVCMYSHAHTYIYVYTDRQTDSQADTPTLSTQGAAQSSHTPRRMLAARVNMLLRTRSTACPSKCLAPVDMYVCVYVCMYVCVFVRIFCVRVCMADRQV